jgi:hypothetical protein
MLVPNRVPHSQAHLSPFTLSSTLVVSLYPTHYLVSSHKIHYPLNARCIAVRRLPHYPLDARCIAMRRLHRYPLNARCIAVRRFPHYPLNARCIAVRSFHRHPLLVRCVSVRRLPVGRLPVGRLPAILRMLVLYAAFVILEHSLCRSYSSGSDWYTRMFYPFLSNTREGSGGPSP